MKKALLITLASIMSVSTFAQVLTPDAALSKALVKLNKGAAASSRARVARIPKSSITLSFTEKSSSQTPLIYVYNLPGGGFIIASADGRANSLLGYTDTGSYEELKKNNGFQGWLSDCTGALEWLSRRAANYETENNADNSQTLSTSVSPILGDIMWDQMNPYNLYCPERTSDDGKNKAIAPTGCVATATAQVMGHFKWPKRGQGSHTNINDETQYYDFSKTEFNWDQIKPTYSSDADGDSAYAIAELMAQVGCAVDMQYGYGSSGSDTPQVLYALTNFFGYDKSARFEQRKYYTTPEWNTILRGELDAGRPMIMGADSHGGGHEFVIDGYDTNGLYHINWGWSGTSNGYFDINVLNPDSQGTGGGDGNYDMNQDIAMNIRIDSLGTSVAAPVLRIESQIQYVSSYDKEFSFIFKNSGVGDFTGEAGFILYDPNNNNQIIDSTCVSFSDYPLELGSDWNLRYNIPDDIPIKVGYVIKPYYRLTPDSEIEDITCPLSAEKFLMAYYDEDTGTIEWGYNYNNNLPFLTCSDVKVLRNYVGFVPKLQVTITNSAESKVEYNEVINANIYYSDAYSTINYCKGVTQCFLNPGESRTIELICDRIISDESKVSYMDMKAGEYMVDFNYKSGDYLFKINETGYTYTMIAEDTCDIDYSDFAIDKTELCKGDMLKASFNAKNYGGFTCDDYRFVIYKVENRSKIVTSIEINSQDIPGHEATTTVTMQDKIQLTPGEYVGNFENVSANEAICGDDFYFTVKDAATDVESIQQNEQQKAIYNVVGRRVKDTLKAGIYIIDGKKVMK